jgi:outer membrane protein assembly factor BamB
MSRRRRLLIIGAAACALLVVAGAGVAWWIVHEPVGDVHAGATLPFTPSEPTLPSTDEPAEPKKDRFGPAWPLYGRVDSRTRNATELNAVKPPYRVAWKVDQHALIEFPPSYNRGVLYLGRDDGWLVASNVFTGKVLWKHRFGSIPDQPAIWEGKLYFGTFDKPGSVYAVDAKTGHVIWRRQLTDQVESSMVVVDGRVFTGCNDGTVRALNALTGKVMWQYRAAGAVKDSLAVDGGRVFFGAYGGTMYSLRASDGKVLWDTHTSGLSGGYRSGNFYSSPAVAYGRVYIGNTDGKVYSFVASTGQVAWTSTFPDWAYGSPGVASGVVYSTSYDGTVGAMNARTGARLWTRKLPYRSLSSATIIGNLVYVADMGEKARPGNMYGLDPRTGAIRWHFNDGEYHGPVVAAGRLIISGFTTLYALRPEGGAPVSGQSE